MFSIVTVGGLGQFERQALPASLLSSLLSSFVRAEGVQSSACSMKPRTTRRPSMRWSSTVRNELFEVYLQLAENLFMKI